MYVKGKVSCGLQASEIYSAASRACGDDQEQVRSHDGKDGDARRDSHPGGDDDDGGRRKGDYRGQKWSNKGQPEFYENFSDGGGHSNSQEGEG